LQPLAKLLDGQEITVIARDRLSLKEASSYDAVILTGGHSLAVADHDREYANELDLIKNGSRPVIGICLGFELIAHAFGAVLHRLEEKEKGIVKIQVVRPHPVLAGLSEIEAYESHRWAIKDVQRPLIELAASPDGCEIVMHESRPIFGFQFHPEMFPDRTTGEQIMKNCLKYLATGL